MGPIQVGVPSERGRDTVPFPPSFPLLVLARQISHTLLLIRTLHLTNHTRSVQLHNFPISESYLASSQGGTHPSMDKPPRLLSLDGAGLPATMRSEAKLHENIHQAILMPPRHIPAVSIFISQAYPRPVG